MTQPGNQEKLDVSIGVGSDIPLSVRLNDDIKIADNSSIRREVDNILTLQSPMAQSSQSLPKTTPSRLEVTLTAEPDQPIIVKVQGGEKQFLISALTKHIYEILSLPQKGFTTTAASDPALSHSISPFSYAEQARNTESTMASSTQ